MQRLSRDDAIDYLRNASYAAGEYPSTERARILIDEAGGDIDEALRRAKLPPRAGAYSPPKPSIVKQLSAKFQPPPEGTSYAPIEAAPTPLPPPVKIQRSGSNYFHKGVTYPAELHYHAAELRNGFIRKVYGILTAQMLITVAISAGMMYSPEMRAFTLTNATYLIWPIIISSLVTIYALQCTKDTYPCNYAMLILFTILQGVLVGFVNTVYLVEGMADVILEAFALTASLFCALSLYACQSKRSFAFLEAGLFAGLWLLIAWGLLQLIFPLQLAFAQTAYSLIGALLFCGFILFDTWKVCQVYGYDDYIVAAIELYLDIINLFLHLLQLLASSRE